MYSSLSSERTIQTENNFEYSRPRGYCSDRWWNRVLVLQQRTRTFQLKGRRDAWGYRNANKSVWRNCRPSRWNKPTALCVYRNTVFVCDTGNKAARMLKSVKGLIPLQSKMAQYANVCRLDKKAKEEDLPRTFEDHVKCVEELVAFLSNREKEALGKRNTNGPEHDHTSLHPHSARIADQPYKHANGDRA